MISLWYFGWSQSPWCAWEQRPGLALKPSWAEGKAAGRWPGLLRSGTLHMDEVWVCHATRTNIWADAAVSV